MTTTCNFTFNKVFTILTLSFSLIDVTGFKFHSITVSIHWFSLMKIASFVLEDCNLTAGFKLFEMLHELAIKTTPLKRISSEKYIKLKYL